MNKQYRLAVFDWEGTLSDTLGQILNCVAQEAQRLQFGNLDEDLARQYVDLGLVNAIRKLFPHLDVNQHQQLLAAVQQSMLSKHADVYLMPGARDIVQKLAAQGMALAIASNKSHAGLQRALQQTGLSDYFKVTRTAGQLAAKPDPEMLEEILQECMIPASDALMIGDSVNDIQMASSIHVDAVGVNFYHQQNESLYAAGALAVFHDFESVGRFLNLPKEG